jgi:GDPmannose 4,6-dehydratase
LKALITGGSGQDGRILARKLINDGHEVIALCKLGKESLLSKYCPEAISIGLDLTHQQELLSKLNEIQPDVIFNLAGFSSVKKSWSNPSLTVLTNSLVPAILLEWCLKVKPDTRFLQASSSEIFGGSLNSPQNEKTSHSPITPYGLSKSFSHNLVCQYREEFGLHASNAVLYNHESPLRSEHFVTRKITKAVAAIARGSKESVSLGNTNAIRDWGWAPDYVDAMYKIIENDSPEDYIIATGVSSTVKDILKYAFKYIGISDYDDYLEHEFSNDRSVDPVNLVGDNTFARAKLNWAPTKNLEEIVCAMVEFDIRLIDRPELTWITGCEQINNE